MSGIKDYSTTPANNNSSPPNGFPEGMAPASLNDGMRQVMADIRSWFEDPAWIDFGDTPTQTGASTFTVSGDRTSRYTAGTRIKMTGTTPFTLYGTISTSSYSAPNTTVTVRMDSGSLDSTLNTVSINKVLQVSQTLLDGTLSLLNTSDLSKKVLLSASGLSTGTSKTFTFPDKNGTFAMTDDISFLRNFIDGYQMSTAGSSTTMTIGAGQAANSTNAAYITLASSINKTTGSWTVGTGNGGLDTGTIANSTWYHFYAIRRPDTGVVDVVFSTNATSPTLPTNYTQFRRIGSAKTNGSGQWVRFFQDGDNFVLDVSVEDISSTNPGTSAVTRTLASVPTGIVCYANIQTQVYDPSSMLIASLVTSLDKSDETPVVYNSGNNSDNATFGVAASVVGGNVALLSVKTNTSAQVRSRLSGSNAGTLLTIRTRGWIDKRGKE